MGQLNNGSANGLRAVSALVTYIHKIGTDMYMRHYVTYLVKSFPHTMCKHCGFIVFIGIAFYALHLYVNCTSPVLGPGALEQVLGRNW